jgi:hypothetical protein
MVSHLVGFYYFILSAFRDPEPYQPRQSCTGFDSVEGQLIPRDVIMIDKE